MSKFKCPICSFIYDEAQGIPDKGIPPGTKWEDVPIDFVCPLCGARKEMFTLVEEAPVANDAPTASPSSAPEAASLTAASDDRELTVAEISVICSNLAKASEKQQRFAQMQAFNRIADYYWQKALSTPNPANKLDDLLHIIENDLTQGLELASAEAAAYADRGAKRSLVWAEKSSLVMQVLLERFTEEGEAMLESTRIYVCSICGYIHVSNAAPEVCPVCKVPSFKILEVERR
jgi:rubredoxin